MGSVLGYLIAGILIGPYVLEFVGDEGVDIMHFAEFGVVMMLFLIGLELESAKFWQMCAMITRVGLSQVLITSGLLFAAMVLLGLDWKVSLATSLSLSLPSMIIVLQSLKEKNLLSSSAGKNSFAVLPMQDIAVITILAVMPLLAVTSPTGREVGNV